MRFYCIILYISLKAATALSADEDVTKKFSQEFRAMVTGTAAEKGWTDLPSECPGRPEPGCSPSKSVKARYLIRVGKALSSRGYVRKIRHGGNASSVLASAWQARLFFEFQLYSSTHTETYDGRALTGKTWQSPGLNGTLKVWLHSDLQKGWEIRCRVVNDPGQNYPVSGKWMEQVLRSRLIQHLKSVLGYPGLSIRAA